MKVGLVVALAATLALGSIALEKSAQADPPSKGLFARLMRSVSKRISKLRHPQKRLADTQANAVEVVRLVDLTRRVARPRVKRQKVVNPTAAQISKGVRGFLEESGEVKDWETVPLHIWSIKRSKGANIARLLVRIGTGSERLHADITLDYDERGWASTDDALLYNSKKELLWDLDER